MTKLLRALTTQVSKNLWAPPFHKLSGQPAQMLNYLEVDNFSLYLAGMFPTAIYGHYLSFSLWPHLHFSRASFHLLDDVPVSMGVPLLRFLKVVSSPGLISPSFSASPHRVNATAPDQMNLPPFIKTLIALELPKVNAIFHMWPSQCFQRRIVMSFNILAAVLWRGLFHPRYRLLHLSLLIFMRFISAHFFSLLKSFWMALLYPQIGMVPRLDEGAPHLLF